MDKSKKFEGEWLRKNGRRTLFLHSNELKNNHKVKFNFETGIVRSVIEHKIDGVGPLIEIGNKLGFKKLTLRMKICPNYSLFFSRIG